MHAIIRPRFLGAVLSATSLSCVLLAQQSPQPPAPIPAQIITARKVFIANLSADGVYPEYLNSIGGPNRPYQEFYAAMKNLGRYELVATLGDADLVFEIQFRGDPNVPIKGSFAVTILDVNTHFPLWTVVEPVEFGGRQSTKQKNVAGAIARLVESVKNLAVPPATTANPQK